VSKVGPTVARGDSTGREPAEAPFAGFPPGAQATPIPSLFFIRLLPRLTDPVELGLALYVFYLLHRKKGYPRFLTRDDLAAEGDLALFLQRASGDAADPAGERRAALERGLAALVEAGFLLAVPVEGPDGGRQIYFLNAAADRRAAERFRRGELKVAPWRVLPEAEPVEPRRSIYALYEENIGPLTPLVADELREAEELYPQEWLRPAFERAAVNNKRSWRYVARILERWATEGPDYAQAGGDTKTGPGRPGQLSGRYRDLVSR
jgi:DnaD/phage-associated family protein